MNNLFNCKKGEKYLSIFMFAIWVVVGLAVVGGVTIFFNTSFDVRGLESQYLNNKIVDCLIEDNLLDEKVLSEDFSLAECGISQDLFEQGSFYFVKIEITGDEEIIHKFGNGGFEADCEVKEGLLSAKNYAECFEQDFSLGNYEIKILTASDSKGGRSYD
jgi:hypothetical protein